MTRSQKPSLAPWLTCAVLLLAGCSPKTDRSAPDDPATELRNPLLVQWADGIIAVDTHSFDALPPEINTRAEIVRYITSQMKTLNVDVLGNFQHKGFLFIVLKVRPDQSPTDEFGIFNSIVVDLRTRRHWVARMARA